MGAYVSWNHFGAGDIPMSTVDYEALQTAEKDFIHIPFMMGAISFFHSVPMAGTGVTKINLDACALSAIFQRTITTWDHADILALNPGMVVPADQAINVVRRVYGSSSTKLASQYLSDACPGKWEIGVGKGNADSSNPSVPTADPRWPADTIAAQVGPVGCCSPRHSTHFEPLFLDLNGIL